MQVIGRRVIDSSIDNCIFKHEYALFFRSEAEITIFDQEMFRLAPIIEGLDGV